MTFHNRLNMRRFIMFECLKMQYEMNYGCVDYESVDILLLKWENNSDWGFNQWVITHAVQRKCFEVFYRWYEIDSEIHLRCVGTRIDHGALLVGVFNAGIYCRAVARKLTAPARPMSVCRHKPWQPATQGWSIYIFLQNQERTCNTFQQQSSNNDPPCRNVQGADSI